MGETFFFGEKAQGHDSSDMMKVVGQFSKENSGHGL